MLYINSENVIFSWEKKSKNSGIVKLRKEGTCIYYYLDPDDNILGSLITLFSDKKIMEDVPDRSGELI